MEPPPSQGLQGSEPIKAKKLRGIGFIRRRISRRHGGLRRRENFLKRRYLPHPSQVGVRLNPTGIDPQEFPGRFCRQRRLRTTIAMAPNTGGSESDELDAVLMAVQRRRPRGTIIHSDQGSKMAATIGGDSTKQIILNRA